MSVVGYKTLGTGRAKNSGLKPSTEIVSGRRYTRLSQNMKMSRKYLKACLAANVFAILLIILNSCSPLTPYYKLPPRPVEKPSCADYAKACSMYDPKKTYTEPELRGYIDLCMDAFICVHSQLKAEEAYNQVLTDSFKGVN